MRLLRDSAPVKSGHTRVALAKPSQVDMIPGGYDGHARVALAKPSQEAHAASHSLPHNAHLSAIALAVPLMLTLPLK